MGVRDFTLTPFFILIQQKAATSIDGEMNVQMVHFDSVGVQTPTKIKIMAPADVTDFEEELSEQAQKNLDAIMAEA